MTKFRLMTKFLRHLEDDDNTDRILRLPKNVIELILGFLSVRDAARTCVLSTKWRYIWVDQTSLVLDEKFWAGIIQNKMSSRWKKMSSRRKNAYFAAIANKILVRHIGNVQKFVLDISVISSEQHCDISLWLSMVCGRGVKELSIMNSASNAYTIPSCVFYAPELTNLSISMCTIKKITKATYTCFMRLQSLTLNRVAFDDCVLVTPLLTHLSLDYCSGVRGFSISAPKLETLILNRKYKDYINLMPYLICTNIKVARISISINDSGNRGCFDNVNLQKLFHSWPNLERLLLEGSLLKYLTAGIALDDFSLMLKLRHFRSSIIDLPHDSAWIFRIMENSPFLHTLEICLSDLDTKDFEALKYLEEPSIMNLRFQQLHTVKIRFLKGLKSELQFVEVLLHCSPSLKKMVVEEYYYAEKLKITNELMRFQRVHPKPEIIFAKWCKFS